MLFRYSPLKGVVHRLDPRIKIPILMSLSLSLFRSPKEYLWVHALFLTTVIILSRIPLKQILLEARGILFLLVLILAGLSLSIPGDPFLIPWISLQGITAGAVFCLRLILILLCGIIFLGTTLMREITSALQWYLGKIPFIHGNRLAVSISLTLRMVPLIHEEYRVLSEAQASRCFNLRRNPVSRISRSFLPLFISTLKKGDEIVLAMEARCFTEERTSAEFSASVQEVVAGLLLSVLPLVPLFIGK